MIYVDNDLRVYYYEKVVCGLSVSDRKLRDFIIK